MLSGMGVSGNIVMGKVIQLNDEQLCEMDKYLKNIEEGSILVVSDISLKDALMLDKYNIVGFITEKGGFNSHLAILARKMEVAAVIGVAGCMDFITTGDKILMSGIDGKILVNPRDITIERYMRMQKKIEADNSHMNLFAGKDTVTMDGVHVTLMGNIDDIDDIERIIKNGGEGVGLFRTENIFSKREILPTEDEQFEIYKSAAIAMKGKIVTIRTLDAGGDHNISYLDLLEEDNPFLGCRGIRYSLKRPDIFKTQCRAILRASAYGNIRIMLPMLTSLAELQRVKNVISLIKEELDTTGIKYDNKIKIGVMIETPAAVWLADLFAKECDFLSIGTNDLTQYTIAADRGNKQVANVYSSYHPAVLRSIRHVVECAKKEGIPISICGEAAVDIRLIPLFLLYGVDELSVGPANILHTRRNINEMKLEKFSSMIDVIDNMGSIQEVESCIDAFCAIV